MGAKLPPQEHVDEHISALQRRSRNAQLRGTAKLVLKKRQLQYRSKFGDRPSTRGLKNYRKLDNLLQHGRKRSKADLEALFNWYTEVNPQLFNDIGYTNAECRRNMLTLLRTATRETVDLGQKLYKSGAATLSVFIVLRGSFRLIRQMKSGEKLIIRYLEEGDLFGYEGVLDEGMRRYTSAISYGSGILKNRPAEVLRLGVDEFRRLLKPILAARKCFPQCVSFMKDVNFLFGLGNRCYMTIASYSECVEVRQGQFLLRKHTAKGRDNILFLLSGSAVISRDGAPLLQLSAGSAILPSEAIGVTLNDEYSCMAMEQCTIILTPLKLIESIIASTLTQNSSVFKEIQQKQRHFLSSRKTSAKIGLADSGNVFYVSSLNYKKQPSHEIQQYLRNHSNCQKHKLTLANRHRKPAQRLTGNGRKTLDRHRDRIDDLNRALKVVKDEGSTSEACIDPTDKAKSVRRRYARRKAASLRIEDDVEEAEKTKQRHLQDLLSKICDDDNQLPWVQSAKREAKQQFMSENRQLLEERRYNERVKTMRHKAATSLLPKHNALRQLLNSRDKPRTPTADQTRVGKILEQMGRDEKYFPNLFALRRTSTMNPYRGLVPGKSTASVEQISKAREMFASFQ